MSFWSFTSEEGDQYKSSTCIFIAKEVINTSLHQMTFKIKIKNVL